MKVDIFNMSGEKTGNTQELPETIYGIEPHEHSVYLAVKAYHAAQRQGTHSSKERNAVAGSGRKIKKQKGTGTARAGDIKNPIFRGGGRVFGPKPRDYRFKLNKKVRDLARRSVIADKARSGDIVIVDSLNFDEHKTRLFKAFMENLNLRNKKILVLTKDYNENAYRSSRNLKNVVLTTGNNFNFYQVINADKLVIEQGVIDDLNALLA